MFEHYTCPNPDDTYTDGSKQMFWESIRNDDDFYVNFLEADNGNREQLFAYHKIEVLGWGLG